MNTLPGQALRFSVAGLLNTAIGLSVIFALMYLLDASPGVANAVGYGVGLCFSYGLNRGWTFRNNQPYRTSLGKFAAVVGISYLVNLMAVLSAMSLSGFNPYLAQLLGVGIYTVCMFFGCRHFVFALRPELGAGGRPRPTR